MSKLSERRREIRSMDMNSANEELQRLRRKMFDLRLQKERGEVSNNREFPSTRADIARLMQHLGDLSHAAAVEAEGDLTESTDEGQE